LPDILKEISQKPNLSKYYANKLRARNMLKKAKQSGSSASFKQKMRLGYELLSAGETQAAIKAFQRIEAEMDSLGEKDAKSRFRLASALAISNLRLGEQENCIANHNPESCIMPIAGGGVYQLTRGPEKAAKIYLKLLKKKPEMIEARWLLNLCHMTLGTWPDSVPEAYRINPAAFASNQEIGRFPDVAMRLGVDENATAGGICLEDFDQDGDLDIIVSAMALDAQMKYFRNEGDGSFSDQTEQSGLSGQLGGLNINHADFNNDGFADVLVLRGGWGQKGGEIPNSLLQNNGDGSFTDVTREAGVFQMRPTQAAAWADFNLDGWLDLVVFNESSKQDNYPTECYLNQKDGTFVDMAAEAGLTHIGYFKGVVAADFNNDGAADLYVSDFKGENLLYLNETQSGDGAIRFKESGILAGVALPKESFPVIAWDYNHDGLEDIMVFSYSLKNSVEVIKDYLGQPFNLEFKPALYRNMGDGTFEESASEAGLRKALLAMGVNFGDLDNDGWLDIYVGTGAPNYEVLFPNRMFRNDGTGKFQDVTTSGGFGHIQKGHGIAFGDWDRDGDQDVYANMGGAFEGDIFQNALFQNPGHGNNWIVLRLEGVKSNRAAIGARVKLVVTENGKPREIFRTVSTGGSFGSAPFQVEVGLGKAAFVDQLEIRWPVANAAPQLISNLQANHAYHIKEGESVAKELAYSPISLPQGGMHHHHHPQ
jgi:hypothetical protein